MFYSSSCFIIFPRIAEYKMIYEQWFVFVQERIVLPEASTERVWSWELQVDGGQEPFSPTGTDG